MKLKNFLSLGIILAIIFVFGAMTAENVNADCLDTHSCCSGGCTSDEVQSNSYNVPSWGSNAPQPGYYSWPDAEGKEVWYNVCVSCNKNKNKNNPPPCRPSCGGKECGGNGCGGSCPVTCETQFKSGCSGTSCSYYAASMTNVALTTPCITEADSSRTFTVSGHSGYCGDVTIDVDYGGGVTDTWTDTSNTHGDYDFTHTFSIPLSVDLSPEPTITIEITGNRNSIKAAQDEGDYSAVCSKTRTLNLKYKNLYYCPKENSQEGIDVSVYDIYDQGKYFDFYTYDYETWDSCVSLDSVNHCSDNPTDCIDESGDSYVEGIAIDSDGDNEYEYCYTEDGIQGGWLDPDILEEACEAVDDVVGRTALWLECAGNKQCENAIDDAPNGKNDDQVCCGDDYGELALGTKSREEGTSNYLIVNGQEVEYKACCAGSSKCVDELGICRDAGYEYCLVRGGVKGVCENNGGAYEWTLYADSSCTSLCEICDVNSDGRVDSEDITAIDVASSAAYDSDYDINSDGYIDDADIELCNLYYEEECLYCGDNIFSTEEPYNEECEAVSGTTQYVCDDFTCSGDEGNNTKFVRTGCSGIMCNCQYENGGCDATACGGCAVDGDCSAGNEECDTTLCSCTDYVIGKELSMHLFEVNCGYKMCVSSDADNGRTDTFKGTITSVTSFSSINLNLPGNEAMESSDSVIVDDINNPTEINFELDVTSGQDCFTFYSDGNVEYDFTINDVVPDPAKVYFELETGDENPTVVPFYFATSDENECRVCVPDEMPETSIDGRDNDCDGLVDEPDFTEEGVYIWDANCEYFLCVYDEDGVSGTIVTDEFKELREIDWESNDGLTLSPDLKTIEFSSNIDEDDMDCFAFRSEYVINFDLGIDKDEIYIGYDFTNPYLNPFDYANPVCALQCDEPGSCGQEIFLIGQANCDADMCLFDCGGYWVDTDSSYDFLGSAISNPGDYCEDCEDDMECSEYNNDYTCYYDPCDAASSRFGCAWDTDTETCGDPFELCVPGTSLCSDGVCREYCEELATCIGNPDGKCELTEGCGCEDCDDEQDSCTNGAVCAEEVCGCPDGTTLCTDGTCDYTCENNGGKAGCSGPINGVCEQGEGCACEDCSYNQDSCVAGALCDYNTQLCRELRDFSCPEGTALCVDGTCDDTCDGHGGKSGCMGNPDGLCTKPEGCACEDCYGKRDSCDVGLVCDADDELCEDPATSGGETSGCVDADGDSYFEIDNDCYGSEDCDDSDSNVNPGVLEQCDGIDNDCNGYIDEVDCSQLAQFEIESLDVLNVLGEFEFIVLISNGKSNTEQLSIELETPEGIGAISKDYHTLDLEPGKGSEVKFNMFVKDYPYESANIILKVTTSDEEFMEEIPVEINFPDFAIAADPLSKGKRCKNFYYVLNDENLNDKVDIEFNIAKKNGGTLIVDYMPALSTSGIKIGELVSNPYCINYKSGYKAKGFVYQIGGNGPTFEQDVEGSKSKSKIKVKVRV